VSGAPQNTCDPLAGAAPADSICDGVDEDCDGALDEDVVCAPGTVCDPTTGQCESSEIIGTIVQDAYTRASDPDKNFNNDELHVDDSSTKHIFLHVGATGIGGRAVEQVLLRMTVASGSSAGSNHGGSVHVVPCDWDEDLITWANEPVINPAVVDDHPQAVTSGQVVTFDLSGTIPGDGQYCYALTTPSANSLWYVSSEGIGGPTLEITAATTTATTVAPTTTTLAPPTTLASTTTTTTLVSTTTTTGSPSTTTSTPTTTTSSSTTTTSPPAVMAVDVRVSASAHDAEEELTSGDVNVGSSDLELTVDGVNQVVGMNFAEVMIPRNADIARAYVQFTVDNETTGPTTLAIRGEAADDALPYDGSVRNISSRPPTAATVPWINVPAWPLQGESTLNQRTPDIASIIQEIIERSGWVEGNALGISITGTGSRVADSYDGNPATAPMLHVEYFESGTTTSTSSSTSSTTSSTMITTTTTTISPSAEATGVVVADASTRASKPDRNYNNDELTADESSAKRSYVRISVSDVGGRAIQQALLRMTVGPGGAQSAHGGELHVTTCNWDEDTISWNTQPAIDAIAIDAHPLAVAADQEIVFELTGAIEGDGDHCFALTSPSADKVGYGSSETAAAPVVEIRVSP
jgi:hypothetical protein